MDILKYILSLIFIITLNISFYSLGSWIVVISCNSNTDEIEKDQNFLILLIGNIKIIAFPFIGLY